MREGGEEQFRLTNSGASGADTDSWPSYAPDNSKIVFSSNRTGNLELYIMNVDGTSQERITIDGATDNHPNWGLQTTR